MDVGLGYTSLGPALQEQYAFFEILILCGVTSYRTCGNMSETKNCIKNNFKGDNCGIAVLNDYPITGENVIVNGGALSSQVGVYLNASLAD